MEKLSIDIETYCTADLSKCGVYRYCEDPSFQILLFAYSVDDGPVQVVDLVNNSLPKELRAALVDEKVVKWAYNASFERVCLSRFLGWPSGEYLPPEQWRCSMVWGATLGLPLGLGFIGSVLGLEKQKITAGKKLIDFFSKPDRRGRRNEPQLNPIEWQEFIRYNQRDVETEVSLQQTLSAFPVPDMVWEEYWIDQRINDRGVLLDRTLAENVQTLDETLARKFMTRLQRLTGLENPRSVQQLTGWLKVKGIDTATLDKNDVKKLLQGEIDPAVSEVLKLRQLTAKSSIRKYDAMLRSVCRDGRVRGMFQFYGSRTGRWAGRIVQLQNLPQNHIAELAAARTIARHGDLESLEMLYDSVPDVFSQLIRTAFIAKPGTRFIVADFSAIEARVIAWYAGEMWRLKTFAEGGDIYCASASQMFRVPVKKHGINGHLRQKGKVAELACGYGGSVGALKAMGAAEMGLSDEEMKSIVDQWRAASPHIVEFWWAVDRAIKKVLTSQPSAATHGLVFNKTKHFLRIRLPSGRWLHYFRPELSADGKISYEGTGVSRAWTRLESYGPKFVENIVQATARDLLCNAMKRLKHLGIVMHIHDELVIEADSSISLKEVCQAMGTAPDWAQGLPLRADGYETNFYMKD